MVEYPGYSRRVFGGLCIPLMDVGPWRFVRTEATKVVLPLERKSEKADINIDTI